MSNSRTNRKTKTEAENGGFTVPIDANRSKLAKTLTGLPGQVEGNPNNITSTQGESYGSGFDPYGVSQNVSPANTPVQIVPRSQVPENKPYGVMHNNYSYGSVPQPPTEYLDSMGGMALTATAATKYGLNVQVQPSEFNRGEQVSYMGPIGSAAPMPGSVPFQMPQQTGTSIPLTAGTPDVRKAAEGMDQQRKGMDTTTGKRQQKA